MAEPNVLVLVSEDEAGMVLEAKRRSLTQRIVAAWCQKLPITPDPRTLAIQASAAKRIAGSYTEQQIRTAARGMSLQWAYHQDNPNARQWHLTDLERCFVRAFTDAVTDVSATRQAILLQRLEDHEARIPDQAEVHPALGPAGDAVRHEEVGHVRGLLR